jgi:hypothetical protein
MLQRGTNIFDEHTATAVMVQAVRSSEALVSIRQTATWCYN